jgi:hypothetical protein
MIYLRFVFRNKFSIDFLIDILLTASSKKLFFDFQFDVLDFGYLNAIRDFMHKMVRSKERNTALKMWQKYVYGIKSHCLRHAIKLRNVREFYCIKFNEKLILAIKRRKLS